jgi:hypothetical protein
VIAALIEDVGIVDTIDAYLVFWERSDHATGAIRPLTMGPRVLTPLESAVRRGWPQNGRICADFSCHVIRYRIVSARVMISVI